MNDERTFVPVLIVAPTLTHGTVEEEMAQNGYFECVCGKMHSKYIGEQCSNCHQQFPREFREVHYR